MFERAQGCLDLPISICTVCELAWGCIWTWKPKVGRIFPIVFCLFWLIWMWLQSGNSLNVLEPWWFLILAVMCTSHFCFSPGGTEESADRSSLFRLCRTGARLAHLATRWHCSHKEVWSQLHSSAVALRKSFKAKVGKGQPAWLWPSLDGRALWILRHAPWIKATESK